eukprot:gene14070-biopygen21612
MQPSTYQDGGPRQGHTSYRLLQHTHTKPFTSGQMELQSAAGDGSRLLDGVAGFLIGGRPRFCPCLARGAAGRAPAGAGAALGSTPL